MWQACVALLCEVEAFDDAVGLALSFDRGLAEDVARRPADDSTRRQLWLAIAKHLFAGATEASRRMQCLSRYHVKRARAGQTTVQGWHDTLSNALMSHPWTADSLAKGLSLQGGDNLGQVSEFLRAADGAVKIEDVLPLFPDFARIDAFKGASPSTTTGPPPILHTA